GTGPRDAAGEVPAGVGARAVEAAAVREGTAMTEAEWMASTDPEAMLDVIQHKASFRKVRLFAVVCYRSASFLLGDDCTRMAVEVLERHADGNDWSGERRQVWKRVRELHYENVFANQDDESRARRYAAITIFHLLIGDSVRYTAQDVSRATRVTFREDGRA